MPDSQEPQVKFGIQPEEPVQEPEKPRDPSTGRFLDKSSARLLEMARDAGVSEDEIAASHPDELRQAIKTSQLEQKINQRFESIAERLEPKPSTVADDKFDGEDEIAPQIVTALKQLRQENRQFREELSNQEKRRASESFAQKADRAFAELGDYAHVIGKGAKDDFDPDSDEMDVRQVILRKAIRLAGKGATEVQIIRKIKQAAESLFQPKKKQESYGHITPEEWQEAALAKPSHRDDDFIDMPNGDKKAEAVIASYLARNGKR